MSIPPAPHDRPHPDPYDTRTIDLHAAEVGLDAGAAASELVIHGLLEFHRHLDPLAREARINRVLEAIHAEPRTRGPLPFIRPQLIRWALAAAAILAIAVGVMIFGVPGETSALAQVQQSIAALRSPGDRRYEARVLSWADQSPPADAHATIDMRSPLLLIIRHRPPRSDAPVFVGRDAMSEWAIRPDGAIERDNPRRFWPPWSVDDQTLIVDSLDRVLEQLPGRYTFHREPSTAIEGRGPKPFTRVNAARNDRAGPLPHRLRLWIDPTTDLIERIEFAWDTPDREPSDAPAPADALPPSEAREPNPRDHGSPLAPSSAMPGPPPADGSDRPGPPSHPKLIIIQRVEAPQHPADWFTPESHLRRH